MNDEEVISYQLLLISYCLSLISKEWWDRKDSRRNKYSALFPQFPNSPIPQSPPPGGDLIYLGIEAKRDRLCNEVSFPPQSPNPQSPIPIPHSPISTIAVNFAQLNNQ